ncbi:MAG: PAS domain-containing sensor histidine kinase [Pseudomonadota bacterium]|nr:PAS domain-containing sensor histidine kinase [Pseudomonadota bacterium]
MPSSEVSPQNDGFGDEIYRLMAESVIDYGIFLLDRQGYIRTWNIGARLIKGYEADEVIGQHFSIFYPAEACAEGLPARELLGALANGRYEDEGWRLRKDGSRFWANVVITALFDGDGNFRAFSKITRDLTARRAHEELLRRSEERFRLLVNNVRDYAIFMLDPHGNVVSWNIGAQQNKGYLAGEIIGKHFSVFYPPEVAASGWPARELEVALRDGSVEDEGWRIRKDGSRFWASVVITALRDDQGRHFGFAKVTRDLTDKRRVSALEDEGRRITTFIAMLGHELRNPLAPIVNSVAIMRLEPNLSERLSICRDAIDRQTQQLTRLIDDLLDVGRITSGKIHLTQQPVPLIEVLRQAVEAVSPLVRSKGHQSRLELPDAPVWVSGDHARLVQVVTNLLNNAAKFTPAGGEVGVALRREGDQAVISVHDSGPGIPPRLINDIFNLFVQGEQCLSQPQNGLGLGLPLVRQIVALHEGDISVFSVGQPGKGAEFVVRLPAIVAPDDAGLAGSIAHD